MELRKTTTKKYDIKFYRDAINWTWEQFRTLREKKNMSTSQFSKCFICGHKFEDSENVVFITVSSKGNLFSCKPCLEKHESE